MKFLCCKGFCFLCLLIFYGFSSVCAISVDVEQDSGLKVHFTFYWGSMLWRAVPASIRIFLSRCDLIVGYCFGLWNNALLIQTRNRLSCAYSLVGDRSTSCENRMTYFCRNFLSLVVN